MIEKVKDAIDGLEIDPKKKVEIFGLLSSVEHELAKQNARVAECMARQDVYADICNKMLNRICDRNWD